MARVGIVFGLLLCGLTFLALVLMPIKSPTQFIPMMLGIPVLFCGVVALNPHRRKHAMHVASAVGVLGALAGLPWSISFLPSVAGGGDVDTEAMYVVFAMTLLCTVFVAICIQSFRSARRRKVAGEAAISRRTTHPQQVAENQVSSAGPETRESA